MDISQLQREAREKIRAGNRSRMRITYDWELKSSDIFITQAYAEGIKYAEGTKNGSERYQMGYEDGVRKTIESAQQAVKRPGNAE